MFYVAASICPGLNFLIQSGQSKSVSLVQTQSRQQTSGYLHQQIAVRAFHGGLSLCGQRFNRYICHAVPSLLQFITLRHRTSKYYTGSHNQCSGFSSVNPSISARSSMPCSAGSSQRTNAGGQFECVTIHRFKVQHDRQPVLLSPRLLYCAIAVVASAF